MCNKIYILPIFLVTLLSFTKANSQNKPPLTYFIVDIYNSKCNYRNSVNHKVMAFQGKIDYQKIKKVRQGLTNSHNRNGSNVNVFRFSLYKEDEVFVLYESTYSFNGCNFKSIDGFVAKSKDDIEKLINSDISSVVNNSSYKYISHKILRNEKYEVHDSNWVEKMTGGLRKWINEKPINKAKEKKNRAGVRG